MNTLYVNCPYAKYKKSSERPRVGASKERVLNGPAASQSDRKDQVAMGASLLLLL